MELICAAAKVDTLTHSLGSHEDRCLSRVVLRVYEQPVLQRPVTRKEGQGNPHKPPGTEIVWKECLQFRKIRGKVVSFQKDTTTAVSYLWEEGGTHCKELNGLAGKILLRCHRDRITVCPEYPLRATKSESRCPVQSEGSSEMELWDTYLLEAIQKMGNSGNRFVCKLGDNKALSVSSGGDTLRWNG